MSAMMSIDDVMRELTCSRTTVYRLMDAGELASMKLGARRLVSRESFEAYLEREFQKVHDQTTHHFEKR